MTGVSDKIKSIVGFLTSGFEAKDEEGDFIDALEDEMGTLYPTDNNAALEPIYATRPKEKESSKVAIHPNFKGYEVLVCEPRSYDESVDIVKHLKERKTIILNLHLLDKDQSLRIVDFLCGATHALNGNQQKIGDTVFIFTPNNVSLTADTQKNKFLRDAIWSQPQG
ncbi:cell division protein SepF [bacterium]|nr:cell division protein SepF [bacterium]